MLDICFPITFSLLQWYSISVWCRREGRALRFSEKSFFPRAKIMRSMSYDFSNESHKSFQRAVRLMARAFYDEAPPLEKKLKPGQSDNAGLGVLILDRLTNVQWVKEEELVNILNVRRKQVASLLHFFHREKLIHLEYRKEEIKSAKASGDGDDPTVIYGQNKGQEKNDKNKKKDREKKEKEKQEKEAGVLEKKRFRTVTYICIDYAQIYDVLRYRLHHVNKKLSASHSNKRDVQESYICPKCAESYDVFSAMDNNFCCTRCDELVTCANAFDILGQRDESTLQLRDKFEEQLRPINNQLKMLKDLSPPEFVSLQAWEVRRAVSDEQSDLGVSAIKKENLEEKPKVIPPWMKKQDTNLFEGQAEEVKEGTDNLSFAGPNSEDSKPTDNAKSVDEDYIKSYYDQFTKYTYTLDSTERHVGCKSKREDSDEAESDCEDPFETGQCSPKRLLMRHWTNHNLPSDYINARKRKCKYGVYYSQMLVERKKAKAGLNHCQFAAARCFNSGLIKANAAVRSTVMSQTEETKHKGSHLALLRIKKHAPLPYCA